MSKEDRSTWVGVGVGTIVALGVLALLLPWRGPVPLEYDLEWVPSRQDPAVLAAYVEGAPAVTVDRLGLIETLAKEDGYNTYLFLKTEGGGVTITWIVQTPDGDLLVYRKSPSPRTGLRVSESVIEDGTLYATTQRDVFDICMSLAVAVIAWALVWTGVDNLLTRWLG